MAERETKFSPLLREYRLEFLNKKYEKYDNKLADHKSLGKVCSGEFFQLFYRTIYSIELHHGLIDQLFRFL